MKKQIRRPKDIGIIDSIELGINLIAQGYIKGNVDKFIKYFEFKRVDRR